MNRRRSIFTLRRACTGWSLFLAVLVGFIGTSAHADIMHWFWEVEVNGAGVDATQPVHVRAGDSVDIELWAEWDPVGEGFAWSDFAISTGDDFFTHGIVEIDEGLGYGRNEALRAYYFPGTPIDTGGSPAPDIIDLIDVFQFPSFFNSMGDWRHPLFIYAIGWDITEELDADIELHRAPTSAGQLFSGVYQSVYGDLVLYGESNDVLRFVPAPPAMLCVSFGTLLVASSRRRTVR